MSILLCDKGYIVTCIEFSESMARIANETSPKMNLIIGDFLKHDFGNKKYSGILAVAFIHWFTENDCEFVLNKIYSLLNSDGYALISTTKHNISEEWLISKENFKNINLRFRKRFTKDELTTLLYKTGFSIIEYYENRDSENDNKVWMNFILRA